MSGLLQRLYEPSTMQSALNVAGVAVLTMERVRSWTAKCPQCGGEPVRLVGHGDRFNPSQHDECEKCEGLGFVPSEVLLHELAEALYSRTEAIPAAMAVLRLVDEGRET